MLVQPIEELLQRLKLSESAVQSVDVLVLPENLDTAKSPADFIETEDSVFLAKYLKQQGVSCKTAFDFGPPPQIKERRGADVWPRGWYGCFIEVAVPIVLNLISNWLWDRYARAGKATEATQLTIERETRVHVELRIQRQGDMTKIDFSGTLTDVQKVLSTWSIDKEK